MRSAERSLVLRHAAVRGSDGISPKVLIGIGRIAARLWVQRAVGLIDRSGRWGGCSIRVCVEVGARGEGEVTRRLIAVAGREPIHAYTGNDVNLQNWLDIVLGKEGYIALQEVAGAELRACADDLLSAASSIDGIVEEVMRVIDLSNPGVATARD